jgi:hypothetical protein
LRKRGPWPVPSFSLKRLVLLRFLQAAGEEPEESGGAAEWPAGVTPKERAMQTGTTSRPTTSECPTRLSHGGGFLLQELSSPWFLVKTKRSHGDTPYHSIVNIRYPHPLRKLFSGCFSLRNHKGPSQRAESRSIRPEVHIIFLFVLSVAWGTLIKVREARITGRRAPGTKDY